MKNLTKLAFAISLAAASSATIAATADGSLATSSTGTADVTMTIQELFQVSEMAALTTAFTFGTWSSGDFDANSDFCIYHNGDGSYQVTVSDDSAAGGFNVESGANAIAMTVSFNDAKTVTGNAAATEGSVMATQTGANVTAADCTGGILMSANLHINIASAAIGAAPAGSYTSEITIFVEPG
ncbi:MAG: hypothetical protein JKY24_08715 [Pseudomonadales bacterium]|nr:hypothetical protein [Pseudomonadales bacterium]